MNRSETNFGKEIPADHEANQPPMRDEVPLGHTRAKVTLEDFDFDFDETGEFSEAADSGHETWVLVINGGIGCGVFAGGAIVNLDDPSGLILKITRCGCGATSVIEARSASNHPTVSTTITD